MPDEEMGSAKMNRLYSVPKRAPLSRLVGGKQLTNREIGSGVRVRTPRSPILRTGKNFTPKEAERMAAEGGLINDRSGRGTRSIRKRLGY